MPRPRTVQEVITALAQPLQSARGGGEQNTNHNRERPRIKLTEDFFRKKLRQHFQTHHTLPSKSSLKKLPKEMKSFICMTCFESYESKKMLSDHLHDPVNDHRSRKKKFKAKKKTLVDIVNAELGCELKDFQDLHAVYGQMSANLKYRYEYLLYLTICQIKL